MDDNSFAPFNFPIGNESIIKVIGVGGGGGNAVNHMFKEGIHDVTFVVCNTDKKALTDSPVPIKLQLGHEGLGAGNRPEKARAEAEESMDEIKNMLSDNTKMAFITAGMGGGTGTGAAPLLAKVSKEMGILTVGIVTIPFRWEGNVKIDQALDGVEEISKNVDALLVVNNERLRAVFPDMTVTNAFALADDTLCNAAKSISEIITMHGRIHLDFEDVKTVLKDGGVAIMSTGFGQGEGRVTKAIEDALNSPLLNDNDIYSSKKVLLHIIEPGPDGDAPLMMEEMTEITDFMGKMQNDKLETKWGLSWNPELKDKVKVTILASGFGVKNINSDEMDKRFEQRDEEQRKIEAQKMLAEKEKTDRREQIYGPGTNGSVSRTVYTYCFKDEELDNDDVISNVESSPTGKRNRNTLNAISKRAGFNAEPVVDMGATIKF